MALIMARGWESKSVEEQQAAAVASRTPPHAPLSPQQAARQQQQEGLRLSISRTLRQLERAQNPAHREMLEAALADLEKRLASLGQPG